jgi:hypothetical protein
MYLPPTYRRIISKHKATKCQFGYEMRRWSDLILDVCVPECLYDVLKHTVHPTQDNREALGHGPAKSEYAMESGNSSICIISHHNT